MRRCDSSTADEDVRFDAVIPENLDSLTCPLPFVQTEVQAVCPSRSVNAPKRFMVPDVDVRPLVVFRRVTARVDALVLFRKALPGRTEKRLSGETLVAVVQSTDLRECDDLAFLRCRSWPWKRCVLVQG